MYTTLNTISPPYKNGPNYIILSGFTGQSSLIITPVHKSITTSRAKTLIIIETQYFPHNPKFTSTPQICSDA